MDESGGHSVGEQPNVAELSPTEGKQTSMNSSSRQQTAEWQQAAGEHLRGDKQEFLVGATVNRHRPLQQLEGEHSSPPWRAQYKKSDMDFRWEETTPAHLDTILPLVIPSVHQSPLELRPGCQRGSPGSALPPHHAVLLETEPLR